MKLITIEDALKNALQIDGITVCEMCLNVVRRLGVLRFGSNGFAVCEECYRRLRRAVKILEDFDDEAAE